MTNQPQQTTAAQARLNLEGKLTTRQEAIAGARAKAAIDNYNEHKPDVYIVDHVALRIRQGWRERGVDATIRNRRQVSMDLAQRFIAEHDTPQAAIDKALGQSA